MQADLSPPVRTVSAATAKAMLTDGGEIAFLDVREHGQYGEGHPFFVVNCPYSRLELDAPLLVPNRGCRVLLLDDGDGVAERAADRLLAIGYRDILLIDGGAPAWAGAGYALFKGVNVPSKAFGELVEETMETPSVSAEELQAMIARGDNMIVLDGRSPAEFNRMSIPTALSCPNGELAYRIADLAPDPATRVVINCAGRTRSIIGAQTLRNIAIPNEVVALRNGSQGWQLAGFALEYGNDPGILPEPAHGGALAGRRAEFIAANDLTVISPADLAAWQADATRTTYVFDIRTAGEYARGHLPGALHAPGGQLVQATDHWVGVRNARIVITDNLSLRAAMTCYWLTLMGHDAVVLDADVSQLPAAEVGAPPDRSVLPNLPRIGAAHLRTLQHPVLIDVSPSASYREAHIAGAIWGIRPRLAHIDATTEGTVVVMARDARIAALAADEIRRQGCPDVRVLDGDLLDWTDAGLEIVASPATPPDADRIDFLFFVHDRHDGGLESARTYLKWETELLGQMDTSERAAFRNLEARHAEAAQ